MSIRFVITLIFIRLNQSFTVNNILDVPRKHKSITWGYAPDGMSADEYQKLIKNERDVKFKSMNGPRGFKSRSFESFQYALERGEAKHLMAVNPDDVRSGKIPIKDVPYMQRGGSWDNKDILGKKGWQTSGFGMKVYNDGKAVNMKKNKYDVSDNSDNYKNKGFSLPWTNKDKENKVDSSAYQLSIDGRQVRTGSKLNWGYKPPKINNPTINKANTNNDKNGRSWWKKY